VVFVTKSTFFDMFEKKVLIETNKQWNITSVKKGKKRKKRYVSDDVYEMYTKLLNTKEGSNA
jgi:hypothetical protein